MVIEGGECGVNPKQRSCIISVNNSQTLRYFYKCSVDNAFDIIRTLQAIFRTCHLIILGLIIHV